MVMSVLFLPAERKQPLQYYGNINTFRLRAGHVRCRPVSEPLPRQDRRANGHAWCLGCCAFPLRPGRGLSRSVMWFSASPFVFLEHLLAEFLVECVADRLLGFVAVIPSLWVRSRLGLEFYVLTLSLQRRKFSGVWWC